MLHYLLELNYPAIKLQFTVVFLSWLIVILSIAVDLHFGIKKSREDGIKVTHTKGLRLTYEKTKEYLALMVFMLFLDILNPIFVYFDVPTLPLLTILGAIVLVYTEWKSVKEKSSEKFQLKVDDNYSEVLGMLKEYKEELDKLKKK